MQTYDELADRWESLKYGFVLVDAKHHVDINIGYDSKLRKTLLIRNTGKVSPLPSSKAISAENIPVDSANWGLSFSLLQEEISELFIKFCWDIIESTRAVEGDIVEFILNRYNMWLQLLTYKHPNIMMPARQKGLIGELLYLQKLIRRFGQKKAVSSWVGSEGGDRDFVYDNTWTEVKTVSFASDTVSISSLEQLDTEIPGYLVLYRLESTSPEDTTGISVNDIVKKTERMLTESLPAADFKMKLCQYGYSEKPDYDRIRYLLGAVSICRVDEKFPRVVRTGLNPAVSWVKYGLSISAISEFMVEDND